MSTGQVEASSSFLQAPIPGLTIFSAMVSWLALTTFLPLPFLETMPNTLGLALLFFNNLNILISLIEIALGNHIAFIKKDYLYRKKLYEGKEWQGALAFLAQPLSLSTLFSGEKWAVMWSSYALWDPSYQNQESFGFFIDVGNGWSTIPTCVLWNLAILFPTQVQASWEHAWLLVGVLGCGSYWQVMYGTIIYFASYFYNGRHVGKPFVEAIGFVSIANGIWIFFPVFALYAMIIILRDQDVVAVFR